ncbi:MAG: thermonuclease family protein [Ignavibacteriales bacterium]|nr:thermonuclease family protein [Ignavibacteriales bacterium]
MEHSLYHYKATVLDVYDGDTLTVAIDLGFNVQLRKEKIRLNRINAPELKERSKKQGIASRDFLRSLILEKEITLQTIKDRKEKYGRYLGEVWITADGKDVNVNDELVKKGFAKYQKY